MSEKILLQDLASLLGKEVDLSKPEAEAFVRTFFDTILSVVEKEGSVKIKGLGTFKLVAVESRESVDVNTGERIRIDGHRKLSFLPENTLKKRVNKPFESFETVVLNEGVDIACMESLDNKLVAEKKKEYVGDDTEDSAKVEKEEASEEPAKMEQTEEEKSTADSEDQTTSEAQVVSEASVISEEQTYSENQTVSEELAISEDSATEELSAESEESASADDSDSEEASADAEDSPNVEEDTKDSANDNPTRIEHIIPPLKMQVEITKETPAVQHEEKKAPAAELAKEKTENRWLKGSILLLLAVVLCVSSYFAGYYKVLCPDCEDNPQPSKKAVAAVPRKKVAKQRPVKPAVKEAVPKQTAAKDSVREKTSSAVKLSPSKSYRMTGTLATHTLKAGENLYHIARHYYGDKSFARYIIRYNHVDNPDVIHVGSRLRIPKLEE